MKALLINGSPHLNGCTSTALSIAAEELLKNGMEIEIGQIGNKDLHGCIDRLNKYFATSEMPIVSSRYWNIVYGHTPEDVLKDEEGVQIMRILGCNTAFLIRAIAAECERNGLPEKEVTKYTNFIR